MARYYHVTLQHHSATETVLELRFGEDASNDLIVPDAIAALKSLGLTGGRLVKLTGPASLPVAMALAHGVAHLYGAVAVRDPKLGKYVVAISHDPQLPPGMLLE